MPDNTPAPPDLAAIRADYATLKPRERASTLTDAQERLLYEAVPALLAVVTRLHAAIADLETQAAATPPGSPRYEALDAQLELLYQIAGAA